MARRRFLGLLSFVLLGLLPPVPACSGDVSVEDYLPSLIFSLDAEEFPVGMMDLPEAWGHGDYVEENWEIYLLGSTAPPQRPVVSVHVTEDHDDVFACEENPAGRFHVVQYHYYYARNDHSIFVGDHEHDWEWIYVVVLDAESCGHLPYAVSLSSHDDHNHDSEVFYFPWVGLEPRVEVVDGTHPVAYVGDGNAFDGSGESGVTFRWQTFAEDLRLEDGSLSYASCLGGDPVYNETIAYGIDGPLECYDPRTTPWLRTHWDDPFAEGQLGGLPFRGEGCDAFCEGWCCEPGCTWGMIKMCLLKPFHAFGSGPRGWSRPMGVLTTSDGQKVFWEDWDGKAETYALLRRDVGGAPWDTLPATPDSSYVDPTPLPGGESEYKVLGRHPGGWPSRVTVRSAPAAIDPRSRLDLSSPVVRWERVGSSVFGVAMDGTIRRFSVSDQGVLSEEESYPLASWGLFDGLANLPTDLVATRVTFGIDDLAPPPGSSRRGLPSIADTEIPPQSWTYDLLLAAVPGKGTAVFVVRESDHSLAFQSLRPGIARKLAARGASVYAALDQGVGMWRLSNVWGDPVVLEDGGDVYAPPGLGACSSIALGPGSNEVCAALEAQGDSDEVHILGAVSGDWTLRGILSGCPEPMDCEFLHASWIVEDVDGDQGLMLLRDAGGNGVHALVDVSHPAQPAFLGRWKNDLFADSHPAAWMDGRTGALLAHGYQIRGGGVYVSYSACDCLRMWGGFELYQSPLWNDPEGFRFHTCVADQGFNSPEAPDLLPADFLVWPGPTGTYLLAGYYDPFYETSTSGRAVLYETAPDLLVSGARADGVSAPRGTGPLLTLGIVSANPGSAGFLARLRLARAADVVVDVVDASGRRVRAIGGGRLSAGGHDLRWDGRTAGGGRAASGIYFLAARSGGRVLSSEKIVLIR